MNWLFRNWKLSAVAATAITGAIVAGVLWPSGPISSPTRPVLAQLKQNSQTYLSRHAQPWLTCPAAATTCYRWKMQEAAGNITDDLSGTSAVLTANGTPVYSLHTNIPDSTGMNTRRAIGFDSLTDSFIAASATTGDQTTNDFTVCAWLTFVPNGLSAAPRVVNKTSGAVGYSIYYSAGAFTLATNGANYCSSAAIALNGSHLFCLAVDRDTTGHFYMDGNEIGTGACVISAATLSNASGLIVGNNSALNRPWEGNIGEVLITNGLTTLAEHQALYKAFKYPANGDIGASFTTLTRPQTTTAKYLLPPEAGWGVRLGTYGGSATNPQWPVAYSAQGVHATENPLGLGRPEHGTLTNVIGYPNEFDSWTTGGGLAAPTANAAEAPDGSITADRIAFTGNAQLLSKGVVGGGAISAGQYWCARVKLKRVSGTCIGIDMYCSGTVFSTLTDTAIWNSQTCCSSNPAGLKAITFYANAHGSCVMDIADAEYYQNNLPQQAVCTACTGNVNCVCNPSYTTLSWSGKTTYMPNDLERGELVIKGAYAPQVHTADTKRTLADLGPLGYLVEGMQPVALLRNAGGDAEAVIRGKPLTIDEEARDYWLSWDLRNGLTNTNPRLYASLSIAHDGDRRAYQAHGLSARDLDDVEPPTQRQVNAQSITLGCDLSSTGSPINCVDGLDVETTLWARPAQEIVEADADLVLDEKLEGPDYLQGASIPDLCAYDFGVASANRWCWNGAGYSGSLYDQINGVALAPTGTPTYQVPSGLLVRGQGRRGVNFTTASTEYVQASSTSVADPGAGTAWTQEVVFSAADDTGGYGYLMYSPSANMRFARNSGRVICLVDDGVNNRYCFHDAASRKKKAVYAACSYEKIAGTWTDPIVYVDGVAVATTCLGTNPTGSIANTQVFTIGASSAGGGPHNGSIYGAHLSAIVRTPAEILANYKRTTQTGKYWLDDANTVAHYKMNERRIVNGVGLRDSSGNGNHLTVVNGTPDPQYRDMPWPAGSGVVKPSVLSSVGTNTYWQGGTSSAVGQNATPFSLAAWIRLSGANTGNRVIVQKYGTDHWRTYIDPANGRPYWNWDASGGTATTYFDQDLRDGRWHLVAAKATYSGGTWTPYVSVDGAAFVNPAAASTTGTVTDNTANIVVGGNDATSSQDYTGVWISNQYALTDADVAALYGSTNPKGDLTHARTSTGPKGACWDVANDPVDGVRVRCWGDNQVPHAYSASLIGQPGNERLGLYEPDTDTTLNLALQSEDAATTWANNNTTDAVNTALAPDGTKTADTVTATAGAGDLRQVFAAIAAQPHTYCQMLQRNQATDVAGFVRLVTNSTGAQIAQTAFTATSAWQRFCVSGTATLNDTRVETQITTNGHSVFWWGASLTETATWPSVYCPTNASSQTCNAWTSNLVASAELTSWDRSTGIIVSATLPDFNGGYGWRLYNGVNANGIVYWLPTGTQAEIYNSVGVTQQDVRLTNATPAVLTGGLFTWDATGVIYGARRAYGRNFTAAYAGPWDTWTVDTGANWVSTTDTNFTIGGNSTRVTGAQIWKR